MLYIKIQECLNFIISAVDGVYGWINEALALIAIVIVFNFFAKWVLNRLQFHFEKRKKIWQCSFVQSLHKPLSYFMWLFMLVHVYDLIAYKNQREVNIQNMNLIIKLGAVGALCWFLLRWKKGIVRYMIERSKRHEILFDVNKIDVIDKLVTLITIFISVLLVLEITDRSVNTLIAFGGIGGLALAFASQEIIANFFGSIMIYITQPFSKGDWISIPEKKMEGIVEEIGWYMTRIRSFDKRPIYIPNSVFSKIVVITPSRMSHRQFKEIIGLRHSDLPKLEGIFAEIRTMFENHPNIDKSCANLVQLNSFGAYSLDMQVIAFFPMIYSDDFPRLRDDLFFKIAGIISKHDARIAFPSSAMLLPEPVKQQP